MVGTSLGPCVLEAEGLMAALGRMSGMEVASQEILGLGRVGLLAGDQSQGWVFGIDTEQRGGVCSWPGKTWGNKKTQLSPRPLACALLVPSWSSGHLLFEAEMRIWVPPLSPPAGLDRPGLRLWLCHAGQVKASPKASVSPAINRGDLKTIRSSNKHRLRAYSVH